MVPRTTIGRGGLETSRLGLGTSRLHYASKDERRRLIALAIDLGITHFDTAPVYGDGLAERALGEAVRGRRDGVVIATKFGFVPDRLLDIHPRLGPVVRPVRSVARRAGFWHMRRAILTETELGRSVETSLRRLGTESIDILLLHDATRDRIPSADRLLEAVGGLRRRGLIRRFGLAGPWASFLDLDPALMAAADIIQSVETDWPSDHPPDITYGAMAGGPQSAFAAKPDTPSALGRLQVALARRPHGVVLVSTTSEAHLREAARCAVDA